MMEESESTFEVGTGLPPMAASSTVGSQIKEAANTVVTQSNAGSGADNPLLSTPSLNTSSLLQPAGTSAALLATPTPSSLNVSATSTLTTPASTPAPTSTTAFSNSLLSTPLAPPSQMPTLGSFSTPAPPSVGSSFLGTPVTSNAPGGLPPPQVLAPVSAPGSTFPGAPPPPRGGFTPVTSAAAPPPMVPSQGTPAADSRQPLQVFTPDASLVPTDNQPIYPGTAPPPGQYPGAPPPMGGGPPPMGGAYNPQQYYPGGQGQPVQPMAMRDDSVNISFGDQPMNMYTEGAGQPGMVAHGGEGVGSGLLSWIKSNDTVNKMMEKAKSSVETMITTLDPQMKEVLYSGGDINILVGSAKEIKIGPVRDAFQQMFGRATVVGLDSQSSIAPQPVGFSAGLQGAQQRIEHLRRSGMCSEHQVCVAVENFIVELLPDQWFDMGCLLLKDPANHVELQTFTQATPVSLEYVQRAQEQTPRDYPLGWSGLQTTVGQVMYSQCSVDPTDWHYYFSGVSRRDCIFHAARQLAYMYSQRLPKR